ncbi:MAG: HD domain-containing protein [Candidatus Obscuribacter sp.]|nr:HD domain-containing protein [Candidatus Obscuribacter sp.]
MGTSLDVVAQELDVLRYSAMMHDYGKIGVPEEILWKDGRLTPEEYAKVQKHASITYELLINLPFTKRLQSVPYVASCHHEKLDGTGYYRGLKGEEIPFLSRIIAVADVFDALTSVRHYRNRMPVEKVAEILESGKGNHFDKKCVDTFNRMPCDRVLMVMESERERTASEDLSIFKHISWQRLVEIVSGSKPKRGEDGVKESFDKLYNFGLPENYKALD